MSLILNCQWYPDPQASVERRVQQAAELLARDEAVALMGNGWYRLGRSKAQALTKPVATSELANPGSWKQSAFGPGEVDHVLSVWNGHDDPRGVSLRVELHTPASQVDTLAFDGPQLETATARWSEALALARALATDLEGLAIVSSHELIAWAEGQQLERADLAAYAAFWGTGAASRSPDDTLIPRAPGAGPQERVWATTAAQVTSPNRGEVDALIRLLRTGG